MEAWRRAEGVTEAEAEARITDTVSPSLPLAQKEDGLQVAWKRVLTNIS
jgi:hypothetical protein